MDFSSRSRGAGTSASTTTTTGKGRFPLPFSLLPNSMQKNKQSSAAWSGSAPGIAKRQSQTEWLTGRKTLGEYARVPNKLSPTSDCSNNGRLSQMSVGSSRSSTSATDPVKVLFDDCTTEEGRENLGNSHGNNCAMSDDELYDGMAFSNKDSTVRTPTPKLLSVKGHDKTVGNM